MWATEVEATVSKMGVDVGASATGALIALGEVLIDFIAMKAGLSLQEAKAFHREAGGAPANVAVAASRLGVPARFVGRVGKDPFGKYLAQVLAQSGVDTKYVIASGETETTLAFVTWEEGGKTDFHLYGNLGAASLLDPKDITDEMFEGAAAFHFGSVSLAAPQSAAATRKALHMARDRQLLVTFDPNIRDSCWGSAREAREAVLGVLPDCEVVKLSEAEACLLTGKTDVEAAAQGLVRRGPHLVVVTLGQEGCHYRTSGFSGWLESFEIESVDATGAGDAFMGGLLAHAITQEGGKLEGLRAHRIEEMLRYASAVAALAMTRTGAMTALPDGETVEGFLQLAP